MTEFSIIEKYFKPLTNDNIAARNLADDVAKISLKKNEELVVSKDMFVEGVHFLAGDGGFKIASKLLRTNLSDLAAAGAKPLYYSLGFTKNKNCDKKFLKDFCRGLQEVQNEFGLCLIGGDTVSSQEMFFSITIFGSIKKAKILSRNQAKDGDLIFVSGNIGDAALGLKIKLGEDFLNLKKLDKKEKNYLLQRHFFPIPRITLGIKLLEKNLSNCAIDISDGLLADLRHICKESQVDAEIYLEKIPFSSTVQKLSNSQKLDLLSGGDDYELLFAIKPRDQNKLFDLAKSLKLNLSCIGNFKKPANTKSAINLRDAKNKKIPIKKFGYEHF